MACNWDCRWKQKVTGYLHSSPKAGAYPKIPFFVMASTQWQRRLIIMALEENEASGQVLNMPTHTVKKIYGYVKIKK